MITIMSITVAITTISRIIEYVSDYRERRISKDVCIVGSSVMVAILIMWFICMYVVIGNSI